MVLIYSNMPNTTVHNSTTLYYLELSLPGDMAWLYSRVGHTPACDQGKVTYFSLRHKPEQGVLRNLQVSGNSLGKNFD